MWQIEFGTLACSLIGWLCASAPGAAIIQSAYERESSTGSTLHDIGLRVLEAKCHGSDAQRYLCEVTFTASNDPNGFPCAVSTYRQPNIGLAVPKAWLIA